MPFTRVKLNHPKSTRHAMGTKQHSLSPLEEVHYREAPEAGVTAQVLPATRLRRDVLVKKATLQLRRILVLANHFRSLCELRSDPARLASTLTEVIANCKSGFKIAASLRDEDLAPQDDAASGDESRCVNDLERLLEKLQLGSSAPVRELQHAFDALLIQCVLLEALASDDFSGSKEFRAI